MTDNTDTLFEFPCVFPLKVFIRANDKSEGIVVSLVRKHVPDLGEGATTIKPSRTGKFSALTITFTASSKAQLDAIYEDLSSCNDVLMSM